MLIMEASNAGLRHHNDGRNLIYKSGKSKFINTFVASDYPVNLWDDGTEEQDGSGNPITVAEYDRSIYAVQYP